MATLEDPVGKVVIESSLVYNKSLVEKFVVKDYNLYRSDGSYFTVDSNGTIKLRSELPYRRTYSFVLSMLYTVSLVSSNVTTSGYLSTNIRVQAIGMAETMFTMGC